jgi:hypothetical protein
MEVVVLNCWVTETKDDLVPVEQLHHAGKVHERPCQPVDLVDHHDVYLALGNSSQQKFEGRALHGGTGDATIVIVLLNQLPAFAGL